MLCDNRYISKPGAESLAERPVRTRGADPRGSAEIDRVLSALEDLGSERDRAYAPYLAAMA